jgi:tripartite-type tricarboxylate transporter receptor subunit TctC
MKAYKPFLAAAAAMLLSAGLFPASTFADDSAKYPDKPINIVVGFAPGGGTDVYARILGKVLPPLINDQPLVIVNQPGGAQVAAMKSVAGSTPDGYTLQFMSTGSGVLATKLRDRGVDMFKDFRPVAQIGLVNLILGAPTERGWKTPQDLIKAINEADAKGQKLRWGHPGRGSITNLSIVAWLIKNGLQDKVQDVPYKGGAPTKVALMGAQVDFGVLAIQHAAASDGKVIALAMFGNERDPIHSEIPTMAELGLPYVPFYSPMAVMAPKNVPDDIIKKLDTAVKQATESDEFKNLTKNAGLSVRYRGSQEFKELKERLWKEWQPTVELIKTKTGS